jgi:MFS family permease
VFASWVLHVPTVRDALRLEPGVLGLALLGIAAGSLVSMPVAGALITRFGSRAVTRPMALLNPLTLVLPLLAPDLLTLVLALAVYGAVTGALDVAMNAQGVAVERRLARPVLSSFTRGSASAPSAAPRSARRCWARASRRSRTCRSSRSSSRPSC